MYYIEFLPVVSNRKETRWREVGKAPSTTTRIARECQDSSAAPIMGSLPRSLWPHDVVVFVYLLFVTRYMRPKVPWQRRDFLITLSYPGRARTDIVGGPPVPTRGGKVHELRGSPWGAGGCLRGQEGGSSIC